MILQSQQLMDKVSAMHGLAVQAPEKNIKAQMVNMMLTK